ncbi:MAG: response regulator [Candidatus Zhuqueibacterota bacterium]
MERVVTTELGTIVACSEKGDSPRILIIDDDEQVRNFIRRCLEKADYTVHEASDGRIGLNQFHEYPFDVVITDIIMPSKEGIEVILEIRRSDPNIKIIAISGGGKIDADQYLALARNLGAFATITKPFSAQRLLDEVNNALSS